MLCAVPPQEIEREKEGPVQGRLYRSLKLWSFYCDLEESLGTLESARAVYDRILDLRIATPQLVLNYALFLQACAPTWHADALGISVLACTQALHLLCSSVQEHGSCMR